MNQLGLFGAKKDETNNSPNPTGGNCGGSAGKNPVASRNEPEEKHGLGVAKSDEGFGTFGCYLGPLADDGVLRDLSSAAAATAKALSDLHPDRKLPDAESVLRRLGADASSEPYTVRECKRASFVDSKAGSQVREVSVSGGLAFEFFPLGGSEGKIDQEPTSEIGAEAFAHNPKHLGSVESLLARMGAKSELRDWLVSLFPAHTTYVEPFGGSFKVLLWKPTRSKIEIINDYDCDLVHFFRYVVFNPEVLVDAINDMPCHEALNMAFREELGAKRLSGLERAVAFWFGNQSSFNGTGGSYASSPHAKLNLRISKEDVLKVADRLRGVDIRSRSYKDVIEQANKKVPGGVFFYLDPPYHETAGYERFDGQSSFGWTDQANLANYCREIDKMGNRFIQTNSAHKDLDELYKGFHITRREVYYSITAKAEARKATGEYIISNFPLVEKKKQGSLF